MANLAKSDDLTRFDFVKGDRPSHAHQCAGDDEHGPHTWRCNSPYCENADENCVAHGGIPPIAIGREPWRR